MKRFLLTAMLGAFAGVSFGQNTFPTSGNVGIGTLSPGSLLTVAGDLHSSGIIGGNGAFINVLKIPSLDSSPGYFYINTNIPAADYAAPQIQITGYMYGAANKAMKITIGWYHYQGNFYWSQWHSDLGYQKPSRIRLGTYIKNGSPFIRIEVSNNSVYWSNYSVSATDIGDHTYNYYSGWTFTEGEMPSGTTSQIHEATPYKDIVVDGNLGVGTNNFQGYKLAVNGKIRAQEIKVEASPWPDYVFTKDYQLPTLQQTEQHIKEKGHLPGIPSAAEVKTNGIDLGEMNAKLLQKIEELTLHLIEQNKRNDEGRKNQEKKNAAQEQKIQILQDRLNKIENH
ncbi:hypothetical protein [Pedobacter heparinus]|uniref:hypothetical protein n=1 Tax=Pedobacter heparinus TaxID=984 RepID=UPI00292E61D2|nr:hypothetical protein [Pedobacter heparinus]